MDKTRKANQDNLNAWLEKNATLLLDADGRRVYEVAGRQQPFTAVDPDGYVVGFFEVFERRSDALG